MESASKSVSVDPGTATTLPALIRAAAAAYGDDTAIVLEGEGVEGEALSFVELDRQSAELARGLLARGIGKGARVGFLFGNSPTFAVMLLAIARIGAVAVPVSTMIRSNELVRVLRQSDVSGLIVQRTFLGSDYVERLCEALPELRDAGANAIRSARVPYLRWVVSTGEGLPASVEEIGVLRTAAASVDEALLREVEAEVHPTDQLVEIYTSGSMALPKGVRHNHGPVLFRSHFLRSKLKPQRGDRLAVALPMFWVGGMMMSLLPNLEAGATTVCTERTMSNSRVAMGSVVTGEDLELLARAKVYWGLGMSETLGPYSWGDEVRVAGYPLCAPMDHIADGYEVRVADEQGNPVAEGAVGEIQIRGYPVTPGLHKVERAGYFMADGFYHTGDLGLFEGTRLLFVGRNGDIIKTAGSNVSPAEVEMEMQALDEVESAYVLGLPDQERGQLVVAAVIASDGQEPDFAAMEARLRKSLSSYKVPRAYISITREEVPMLPSNKVARRELQSMIANRLGRSL